jgi:hypothetical protein
VVRTQSLPTPFYRGRDQGVREAAVQRRPHGTLLKALSTSRKLSSWASWLTPMIPATQEAEIRRTVLQSQPGQIILETLSQKNLNTKKGLVE